MISGSEQAKYKIENEQIDPEEARRTRSAFMCKKRILIAGLIAGIETHATRSWLSDTVDSSISIVSRIQKQAKANTC